MNIRNAAILLGFVAAALPAFGAEAPLARPKAGKVEIMPLRELKPGMKGTAWTVFQGSEPEPVPVEIIGIAKNMWGPRQDVILGKMGGKAIRTNVAAGMSGSPVYINGKLIGAVALRLSVFSPDAICGITPIELMLEINDFDKSRPEDARTPERIQSPTPAAVQAAQVAGGGVDLQNSGYPKAIFANGGFQGNDYQSMVPIDSPLSFSGITESALREFGPMFQGMGIHAVQAGGGGGSVHTNKPAPGWEHALNPGDSVAGLLVDGDMSATVFGTVTYNDGKRVLAFGHPMFNLGPINMPMSKSEVVTVLASTYQPTKMANATDVVGSLRQDRHSGIMGVLGNTSEMIPVTMKVRSLDEKDAVRSQKDLHFNVFVHQKWTPYLMMLTLYNSISSLNDFVDEATYRLNGRVELNGTGNIALSTMAASGDMPTPAPMALAGWFGDKFNRLYLNNINTPNVKSVNVTVDLIPDRRVAVIENAWAANTEVQAGDDVPVKVFLRPYRGGLIQRDFTMKIPGGLAKGDHRILLSDADTVNRMQSIAGFANRYMDLPETVSLINQERTNNKLYVSLVEASPTVYYDDKTLPSLPSSVLNVMQAGRAVNRGLITSPETASQQMALPFDYLVTGSYSLRIHVK